MPRIPTVEIEVNGRRKIVNANDPRAATSAEPVPTVVPQSPEDVAKLKKPEVIELLEAHEAPTDGNLPELKKRLCGVMFAEL